MKNISTNRFKYVLFIAQTCYVKATISLVTEIKFRTKKSRQSSNAVRWPVTKNRPDLVPVYKQPRVEGKKRTKKNRRIRNSNVVTPKTRNPMFALCCSLGTNLTNVPVSWAWLLLWTWDFIFWNFYFIVIQ